MKTLIVAVTVVSAASAFCADKPVPPTLDEIRASYQTSLQVMTTNKVAAAGIAWKEVLIPLNASHKLGGEDADALAAEIDAKYAEVGIEGPWNWATATNDTRFPKCTLLQFNRIGIETNAPYVVALARQKVCYCGAWSFNQSNASIEELVGLLNENVDLIDGKCRLGYSYATIDMMRKAIQAASVKAVKKYLRKQGKSFVTKNGVNPCEGLMTELNTALNAPYFEGLNAWFAKVGVNASIDTSKIPVAAEVQKLKASILDADKDLNVNDEFVLKIGLGVEGYNAFVKEYNGEN